MEPLIDGTRVRNLTSALSHPVLRILGWVPDNQCGQRWQTYRVAIIEPLMDREALATRLGEVCRLKGEFIICSGQMASMYFDKYLFEADPVLQGP